jgi:hypothetical protein
MALTLTRSVPGALDSMSFALHDAWQVESSIAE